MKPQAPQGACGALGALFFRARVNAKVYIR
jgi:hypothetical protein